MWLEKFLFVGYLADLTYHHSPQMYGEDSQTVRDDDGESSTRKGSDLTTPIEETQDAQKI